MSKLHVDATLAAANRMVELQAEVERLTSDRDTLRTRLAAVERDRDNAAKALWSALGERVAAAQRAADIERATVAGIVAWLDDVEGQPIGAGTLRDFGLQDYANRVDAFRELFAGSLRAGAWRGKEAP
jgi:hypothetical protein